MLLQEGISDLLRARQRNGINMLSKVNILLCGSDIYVARVGENVEDEAAFQGVVLKIGPAMDMRGTCPGGLSMPERIRLESSQPGNKVLACSHQSAWSGAECCHGHSKEYVLYRIVCRYCCAVECVPILDAAVWCGVARGS